MKWICGACDTENEMEKNECSTCGSNIGDRDKEIVKLINERNKLKQEIRELKQAKESAEINLESTTRKAAELIRQNIALKRKIFENGGTL